MHSYSEREEPFQLKVDPSHTENSPDRVTAANKRPETLQMQRLQNAADRFTSDRIIQKQAAPNKTGLPDQLKTGMEQLSGFSMDDVRVHYNSSKPAQLSAHAYAQGTDIHLGPGQEKHLPHEAWHVVQQKQGRVKPTLQLKQNIAVNDDGGLEKEADHYGKVLTQFKVPHSSNEGQEQPSGSAGNVIQRKVGMEYETNVAVLTGDGKPIGYHVTLFQSKSGKWKVEADSSSVEFVTEPFETNEAGKEQLAESVHEISTWAANIEKVTKSAGEGGTALLEDVAPSLGNAKSVGTQKVVFPNKALTTGAIQAAPQATGGVTLDKIPMLYDAALHTVFPHLIESKHGYKSQWKIPKPSAPPSLEMVKKELDDPENQKTLHAELMALMGKKPEDEEMEPMTYTEEEYREEHERRLESHKEDVVFYAENTAPLRKAGLDPETAPYTVSGMNLVSQPQMVDAHLLAGKAIHDLVKVKEGLNFNKLQGLLTLVFNYMIVGAEQDKRYEYSKQIAPIMSRTNFKKLFEALDPHEKEVFTPEFVLKAVNLEQGQLFAKEFGQEGDDSAGPSRAGWIHSIRDGTPNALVKLKDEERHVPLPMEHAQAVEHAKTSKLEPNFDADLLSRSSHAPAVKSYNLKTELGDVKTSGGSSSMGEQNAMDVDGDTGEKLAVLELRRLPKEQHIPDWLPTAMVVFEMFEAIKKVKMK